MKTPDYLAFVTASILQHSNADRFEDAVLEWETVDTLNLLQGAFRTDYPDGANRLEFNGACHLCGTSISNTYELLNNVNGTGLTIGGICTSNFTDLVRYRERVVEVAKGR